MQDIIENARRMASNAVERAAWEADKLRRASARQREIELAERERATLLDQIAHVVSELESRGQLNNATLSALAQRLRATRRRDRQWSHPRQRHPLGDLRAGHRLRDGGAPLRRRHLPQLWAYEPSGRGLLLRLWHPPARVDVPPRRRCNRPPLYNRACWVYTPAGALRSPRPAGEGWG